MGKGKQAQWRFGFLFLAFSLFLCVSAPLRELHAQTLNPKIQAKILAILDSPKLKEAHIGLSILDLGTVKDAASFPAKPFPGKPFRILFERNGGKKFMPASNMKLFTAAIALQLLGKEKTFLTRVFESNEQLILYGGGDPSLKVSDLEDLAQQIQAHGVREFSRVVGDGSAFTAENNEGKFPFGWTLDDTQWYYGPEISALAIERNHVDVSVTGAAQAGTPAKVSLDSPLAQVLGIGADVKTGSPQLSEKTEEELLGFSWKPFNPYNPYSQPYKEEDDNAKIELFGLRGNDYLVLTGQVAPQQKIEIGIPFPNPPQIAAKSLQDILIKAGIRFYPTFSQGYPDSSVISSRSVNIAQHNSPPLRVLFHRLLKNSDNLYAEMLLRNASYYSDGTGSDKAGPHAHQLLKQWLIAQNIDTTPLRFEDGSGLSRYNLLTPRATAELLAAINQMPEGSAIWDALPVAGVDGTLKNRMRYSPAMGNVRAKTGSFSIASNLSGYVTTRDKRRLAVAFYINFARDSDTAHWAQDEVFKALATQGN